MLFSMMQTLSCFGISLENTKNNIIKIKKNMILLCNGNLTMIIKIQKTKYYLSTLNFHLPKLVATVYGIIFCASYCHHFESVVHQLHISIFSRSFEEIETKL